MNEEWKEGLPPVGCECDVSYLRESIGEWTELIPSKVLYADEEGALMHRLDKTTDDVKCYFNWSEIRAHSIRTKEQEEREALKKVLDAIVYADSPDNEKMMIEKAKKLLDSLEPKP